MKPRTEKQIEAILSLELALKEVKDSGLSLYVFDGEISSFVAETTPKGSLVDYENLQDINDHGCYIDSGGF